MMVTLGEIHPFPTATADEGQAAKILEEAAEVFCAWQQFDAKGRAYYRKPFLHSLLCECADLVMACGNMVAGLGMALSTEVEPHYQELDKSCVRELLVRAAEVQEAVYRYEYEGAMLSLYERRGVACECLDEKRRLAEDAANCVFARCEEVVCRVAGLALQLGVEDFTPYMLACEKRNRWRGRYE